MKRCIQCDTLFDGEWHCPACEYRPEHDGNIPIFSPDFSNDNNTYSSEFYENLSILENGHFWFEARKWLLLWIMKKYFSNSQNFLEIGSGTGIILKHFESHLPELELYGCDLLIEGIRFTKQRVASATMLQMDARNIPFEREFDVIGAFDIIEHVEEDETIISQMYSAVKPGGGIIISVPQHQFLWSTYDELSYHKRRYNRSDLVNKVQKAGFYVVKTTSFVSLLLPFMFLNRQSQSDEANPIEIYEYIKINPILNTMLTWIMAFEFVLVRLGVRFPMGGSRIVIAKRPL